MPLPRTITIDNLLRKEKAYDHRGASMGRDPVLPTSPACLRLQRVTIDQGYDKGGAYFGSASGNSGGYVYCGFTHNDPDHDEDIRVYVRAWDREEAREKVRLACHPTPITFMRP